MTNTVSSQVKQQLQNHSVSGTLIITASCTHSFVKLFEPLVVDADKAVTAWNSIHTSAKLDTEKIVARKTDPSNAATQDTDTEITLLAGAGYGSSFIGMV